jgi:putative phosphoribosyl transferase
MRQFTDRRAAGEELAAHLEHLRGEHPVVVGLPRGGVPVAFEVARALEAPLDVIVVRKLGVPYQPELGMGAIGESGVRVVNDDVVQLAQVRRHEIDAVEARERVELERRALRFRAGRPMLPLAGRTVIVVDDGLATGGTARAAVAVARAHGAGRVVLAVPVAPAPSLPMLQAEADEVVVLEAPHNLSAVGQSYVDFRQTTDEEVVDLLHRAASDHVAADRVASRPGVDHVGEVEIETRGVVLRGDLVVPASARGVVLFAHGSGSSRHSVRNRRVAHTLQTAGFATLLLDLLAPQEALDRALVFDIELLADRLLAATDWVEAHPRCEGLGLGYFGASTGAAAALLAASRHPRVRAVVSRGGRPDLVIDQLGEVGAPTLLIVGGADTEVLRLNRRAAAAMSCEQRLEIVPGAGHLFEGAGELEEVAELARLWFLRHLPD